MAGAGTQMVILCCVFGAKNNSRSLSVSDASTSSRSNQKRLRRNYLRPKLLKSLRPIPTTLLPAPALDTAVDFFQTPTPTPTPTPHDFQSQLFHHPHSALKLAVPLFLFHTIFSAVWFLLSDETISHSQPQPQPQPPASATHKPHILASPAHTHASELDAQILHIREMARVARHTHTHTTRNNNAIHSEVNAASLTKLSTPHNSSDEQQGNMDHFKATQVFKAFTFQKKKPTRFNPHSLPPPPKGFTSTSKPTPSTPQQSTLIPNTLKFQSLDKSGRQNSKPKSIAKSQTLTRENGHTTPKSNNATSSLKRNKPFSSGVDLWWLNLPYVLAIFLHRGSTVEGPGGLYTLKIPTSKQNQSDLSYTVAFEDRSDANNFCYILESFFEDLGDFSADIVPLSTKELKETVNSLTMKVIVLRKGQLQLYAGQPLADVEMALRSLIK